jgi:hypothetical protein
MRFSHDGRDVGLVTARGDVLGNLPLGLDEARDWDARRRGGGARRTECEDDEDGGCTSRRSTPVDR